MDKAMMDKAEFDQCMQVAIKAAEQLFEKYAIAWKGNEYLQVKYRLQALREGFGGRIRVEPQCLRNDDRITFLTRLVDAETGHEYARGHAQAIYSSEVFKQMEKTETAASGRACAFFGLTGGVQAQFASFEEIEELHHGEPEAKRTRTTRQPPKKSKGALSPDQPQLPPAPPPTQATQTDGDTSVSREFLKLMTKCEAAKFDLNKVANISKEADEKYKNRLITPREGWMVKCNLDIIRNTTDSRRAAREILDDVNMNWPPNIQEQLKHQLKALESEDAKGRSPF